MAPVPRILVPLVVALDILAGALFTEPADGAVLCAKRSGRVVVAESCRRRETQIEPGDLGLVGPAGDPGPAGAPGEPGVVPYRVVDALGRPVGVAQSRIGSRTQVVLAHPALSAPIQLDIADGLIGEGIFSDVVRYAAAGCIGPPFVFEGRTPLPRGQLVGDTVYYAVGPAAMTVFESVEDEDESCSGGTPTARGTCCRAQSTTTKAAPAAGVPLATLEIEEPFTVEPRP